MNIVLTKRRGAVMASGQATLAVVVAALLLLSACASGSEAGAGAGSSGSPKVAVVASTNVYGDIAAQIAGHLAGDSGHTVQVTSIISNPNTDPHSYEANLQDQLALSKADVVIENGGGYDDFVGRMLRATHGSTARVLDAVKISGKAASAGGEVNEHVWYDVPTMRKVTGRIVSALSSKDPADASTYHANGAAVDRKLRQLQAMEDRIRAAHSGEGVAITEPVPLYLLEACGLQNRTPADFSAAIEEGTDASAGVMAQTLGLFDHKQVRLLVYNEQAIGPETVRVVAAAKANDIPVVPVTESLPAGQDYVSWMRGNLAAVRKALG